MTTYRPVPTGTKRDILRLLAREPLGATSLAHRLQIAEPHVYRHLASLEENGYVERFNDPGVFHERPGIYTIGPAARGTVPKRHDWVLGTVLESLTSRHRPEEVTQLLREAATRLARHMTPQAESTPVDWRCEKALAWIEKTLAWQTIVTAGSDDHLLVAIHGCLLHERAKLPKGACGEFFAELLSSLCGTHVLQMPAKASTACCKLKVFRHSPTSEGTKA